jgi:hypothetical protein
MSAEPLSIPSNGLATTDDLTAIQEQLTPDEKLLWIGKPNPKRLFTWMDLPMTVGGTFFLLGTAWMMHEALRGPIGMAVFMSLMLSIFLLYGVFLTFGRFFVQSYVVKGTTYALTDQRVVITQRWRSLKSLSIHLSAITKISKTCRADGEGTLVFETNDPRPHTTIGPFKLDASVFSEGLLSAFSKASWTSRSNIISRCGWGPTPPVFRDLPNISEVEQILLQAKNTLAAANP